ncbi:MAG: hypothetical protein QOJ57_1781, partial [Thermoleophilaceae bacterium]|nr:hypothetical protein [Thermoleophilaceae bacterium]
MKSVALALLAAALAWAPAASGAERCSAPRATTVVENAEARVFVVKGKGEVKRRFYGCVRGRKPRLLTTSIQETTIDPTTTSNKRFHLSGRFVAWVREVYTDFGAGEFGRSIEERPLEPGHRSVS